MASFVMEATSRGVNVIYRLIDWNESMTWMNKACINNASRAIIPVWAIKAFMTDAINILVTTIANGLMGTVAARLEECPSKGVQSDGFDRRFKYMFGVMAMLKFDVTRNAKVKVLAIGTSNKVGIWKFLNAAIASSSGNFFWFFDSYQSSLRLSVWHSWCESLCDASDHFSVLDKSFDHPVTFASA